MTDSSGEVIERYAYTDHGETTIFDANGTEISNSAYQNPYTYTGRRSDPETALLYFHARMYSPTLGRFISRDPLGYVDGMSLYRAYFVPNGMDPLGLRCQKPQLVCCAFDTGDMIETLNASCDSEKNWRKCCQKKATDEGWRFLGAGHGKECSNSKDCDTQDEARKVREVAVQFSNAMGGNPDKWRRLAELTKLLQKLASMRPKDKLKNKGEVDAIMEKIKELSAGIDKFNGLAIWVRVRGECCDKGKFVSKSTNHKCTASGKDVEIGFDFNDNQGLANAIPGCIKEAINAFDCSKARDK